jgi:hypothetical protein
MGCWLCICLSADQARRTRTVRSTTPKGVVRCYNDAQAGMPLAEAAGAICVQRFDDSRNSAIHTTYRISLRSSSLREPRYPLLRVVFSLFLIRGRAPEGARKGSVFSRFLHSVLVGCAAAPEGTAGVGNAAPALSRVRGPRAAPVGRPVLTRNGEPSKDSDP